jgi:hypothetical protein
MPLGEVKSLDGYDGVVPGGPMIMDWHRGALGFLKRHHEALQDGYLYERVDERGKLMKVVTAVEGDRFSEFWFQVVTGQS